MSFYHLFTRNQPNLNPAFGSHVCCFGGSGGAPNLMPISGVQWLGPSGGLCSARVGRGAGISFCGGGEECEDEARLLLYVRGCCGCCIDRFASGGRERSLVLSVFISC